jgi:hypothetical protein
MPRWGETWAVLAAVAAVAALRETWGVLAAVAAVAAAVTGHDRRRAGADRGMTARRRVVNMPSP